MTTPNEPNDDTPNAPKGVATMAAVRWVLVALAGRAAVASSVASVRAQHHDGGARVESAPQLWQCPMHPAIVRDHPGECPICGMTLVPKPRTTLTPSQEKPAVPGLSPVDLTPERIQLIGMRTDTVKRETLGGELRAAGVVAPSERGLAQITTRFAG